MWYFDHRDFRKIHFLYTGNLGRIDYVNDNEYDLFIRPDTCCPDFEVGFYLLLKMLKLIKFLLIFQMQLSQFSFFLESHFPYC
jgi:hypothetical protein